MCALRIVGSGQKEKVGQCSEETAPLQSGLSYFFFAFLAFLAAFFAFFAIGPLLKGFSSCLMATRDVLCSLANVSQSVTSRCLSVPPSYQM